jgi:hypothetical protein
MSLLWRVLFRLVLLVGMLIGIIGNWYALAAACLGLLIFFAMMRP